MKTDKTLQAFALVLGLAVAGLAQASATAPLPKDLPSYGPDKPLPVPHVAQRTLDNGLTVWVVPREGLPKVDVALAVLGGTASDDAATPALSSLMAGLFNEGTATRSSLQIAEQLQAIGGDYSASAAADAINVRASALASHTGQLLALVADTVIHPAFPAKEVALAKANATQALKVRQANPDWQAQFAFNHAVYGDHPYARAWLTDASIAAATPDSLRALHDARMRPDRALLVIVGRIDAGKALGLAAQAFGDWKASGKAPADIAAAPRDLATRHLRVPRTGAVQSNIRYGRPAVPMKDADYLALNVANTILGGGFASRLTQDIREDKGYSYSPYSRLDAQRDGGSALAVVDVRNEVTGATLDELDRLYADMATQPPSTEELTNAKRLVAGIYLLRNQIQGALTYTLANDWVNGLPASFLGTYVADSNKVTAAQVQAMGRKYFDPKRQSIVVVGDPKAIDAQLKSHGAFETFKP
jgi:predicted Zn-dependent peptidase